VEKFACFGVSKPAKLLSFAWMKASALSELGRRTAAPPISWLMAMALSRPRLVSLAAGFTDNESLPVQDARELLEGLLSSRDAGPAALQYGTTAGDPTLRQLTALRVRSLDAPTRSSEAYSPERMLITNGSQQMLYMLTEGLCDPGDLVLVEDPTYFVYLGILQSHGVRAKGIRLEQDGLDVGHLEQVLSELKQGGELPRLKLLYLVSYYQNPTSATTRFQKKAKALELLAKYERAAGHPLYLLEDTAYRELRFSGEAVPSALTVKGHAERVIYAGTYSKPFATGVRVGFGLLPEPIFTAAMRIKGNHDFGSSNLLAQLLSRALSSGRYQKHLAQLQQRYAQKAEVMRQGLEEYFPAEAQRWQPQGGLYFWVRLPDDVATGAKSKVFRNALANDVVYVPGELCYADDPARPKPNHEMRLSFGAASEENIRVGIQRLGRVLQQLMKG